MLNDLINFHFSLPLAVYGNNIGFSLFVSFTRKSLRIL